MSLDQSKKINLTKSGAKREYSENTGSYNLIFDKMELTSADGAQKAQKKKLQKIIQAEDAENEQTGELEFTATTAAFQLTDDMKSQIGIEAPIQKTSPPQAPETTLPEFKFSRPKHETKPKSNSQLLAEQLEGEINQILGKFKTKNPSIQNQFAKIKNLLKNHVKKIEESS